MELTHNKNTTALFACEKPFEANGQFNWRYIGDVISDYPHDICRIVSNNGSDDMIIRNVTHNGIFGTFMIM